MTCEEERIALIKKSLEGGVHLVMESGRKLVVVALMPSIPDQATENSWIGVYFDTEEPVTILPDGVVVDTDDNHDTPISLWCYKTAEFKGWKHIHPEYIEVSVRLLEDGRMKAVFFNTQGRKEITISLCPKIVTNLSANPKTIVRP